MTHALPRLALLTGMFAAGPSFARAQDTEPRPILNVLPAELEAGTVKEKLGAQLPLDASFRDHTGRAVSMRQFFDGRRPVLLNLAYYNCPMLCSMVMQSTVRALKGQQWTVGNEFDVVTISIDPREKPSDAAKRRQKILRDYGRPDAASGWHFLTGSEAQIKRVADAVGFNYYYDERQGEYAHSAVVMLMSPEGKVARYMYGISIEPFDMRMGLIEASEGKEITTVERVLMYCYQYDPQGRRYAMMARRVMQLGGLATLAFLGVFVGGFWLRQLRARRGSSNVIGDNTSTRVRVT